MSVDLLILLIVSFGASWLTFFCGFGLGTLLTPIFYLLFNDMALAIAATAIVHFLNNIFKFLLMKRSVDWKIVIPFGFAAIPAAFIGAFLMTRFNDEHLLTYSLFGLEAEMTLFNSIFGLILIGFALIELIPKWSLAFSKQRLWVGGLISGFFGGLSGHQGALRTAFLIKYNLKKEVFVATGIVVALIVDVVRTSIYAWGNNYNFQSTEWLWIALALVAALLGAITGKLFLKKIKINALNLAISLALLIFGLALALGVLRKHNAGDEELAEMKNATEQLMEPLHSKKYDLIC